MPARVYSQNGLNDTITFNVNPDGTKVQSFHIEYIDKLLTANKLDLKLNRRKRYLTPNLSQWTAKAQLNSFTEGVKPTFEKATYDAQGGEQKTLI